MSHLNNNMAKCMSFIREFRRTAEVSQPGEPLRPPAPKAGAREKVRRPLWNVKRLEILLSNVVSSEERSSGLHLD